MSARNTRVAKAARRKERERASAKSKALENADDLVQIQSYGELVGLAERGETLPCGCDAHELLHGDGWQSL